MTENTYFAPSALEQLGAALFAKVGIPPADAATIARDLVKANLRGVDSHGISRMPMYLERLRAGLVNPRPEIRIEKRAAAVSLVDGDNGMGFVVSHRAVDEGLALARECGIGLVGVRRSTHFGMGALYALQAIEAGRIGMIFTNSSPAIPIWGGRSAFLGASPMAVGIPGDPTPFVMDLSMTVIARGKIRLAALHGEAIPAGLALDREGNPTTDAQKAFEGVCLPFGGVKGSVLATLMELMAGALTGANFAGEVKSLYFDHSEPQNVGHLFFLIRPDLFMSLSDFDARMDHFVRTARGLPRAQGFDEILIPGEPEQRCEDRRRVSGIPISGKVLEELAGVSERYGIPMPRGNPGTLKVAG